MTRITRNRRRMSNSSFSSISFDAETANQFKRLARAKNKTHTELLMRLMTISVKNKKWLELDTEMIKNEKQDQKERS